MIKIINLIKLLRPWQWYKNLLIFLPIIFSQNLLSLPDFFLTIAGLISLCLISSGNYIINDIFDRNRDNLHPEKKNRPIASGKIKTWATLLIWIVLMIFGLGIAWYLNLFFFFCVLGLFVLSFLYSLVLKHEAILDIIVIGVNFVIRAASGAFIINVKITPWLIICVFFLSLFLSAGKRRGDLNFLGKNAKSHKTSLQIYSNEMTNALMLIATTLLIISYTFYSFLNENSYLILTLPFALYLIFRYFSLIYSGSMIARHPEKIFKDVRMVIGLVLWAIVTFFILYLF